MIITFEGLSGAGKTTQAIPLCEKTGFEIVNFFHQMSGLRTMLDSSRGHTFQLIANCMLLEAQSKGNRKNIVVDDPPFLSYLHPFFNREDNTFCETFLDWFLSTDIVPIASFCLKVKTSVANARKKAHGEPFQKYKSSYGITLFEFYDFLDDRLPFFHLIDGSQSVESIAGQIRVILEGEHGIAFSD